VSLTERFGPERARAETTWCIEQSVAECLQSSGADRGRSDRP
jgi:hypothetical protein